MKRKGIITYVDACSDPHLFADWFGGDSWRNWRTIDKAIFGLPLEKHELPNFTELTGCTESPTSPVREAWLAFGRRAGKDVKASSYVTFQATIGAELYGHRKHLVRGERGVVQLLALDRRQASISFDFCRKFLEQPLLAGMVTRMTNDTVELNNGMSIEIVTNDRSSIRGRTVVCCVLDEVAHWRSENTVTPDVQVYEAIKPAMASIPNSLLIGISSPYSRHGLFYKKVTEHWGKPGRVLAARAPTWTMNPTIPRDSEYMVAQYADDPIWAASEFGAEWRTDLEAFLALEALRACVDAGVYERPHERKQEYVCFCDPSGGSNDSMVLAIAHTENKTQVLDLIRERTPPFSPEAVTEEFSDIARSYRCTKIWGDRYGAEWVKEQFRKHGANYEASDLTRSDLYKEILAPINSGAVALLDHDKMIRQFMTLERRTVRSGKDSIDHPPGAGSHDDIANAVSGALVMARRNLGVPGFRNPIVFPKVAVV